MIEIKNVSKKYDDNIVLNNISFNINKQEIVGLVGPNGVGKTTLIKIMSGLIEDYSGMVTLNNKEISRSDCSKIGVSIEDTVGYDKLTGFKNLKIVSDLYSNNSQDLNKIMEQVGLSEVKEKQLFKYSLGMRKRLGIAYALLNTPHTLMLDEPVNGLDYHGVIEIRNLLLALRDEKQMSIVISSHMLGELEKICDKVIFLKNAQLVKVLDKIEMKEYGIENIYEKIYSIE